MRSSGTSKVIRSFEIYTADSKTGNRGSLITGTTHTFAPTTNSYSTTYTIAGLTDNKAIKVVVTDSLEQTYEKNILIKITPSVLFSEEVKMETVESYYGPYFASWLSGRAYMRNTPYARQIDFSLGDVVLSGGTTKVAALVNPALRKDYNLLTASALKNTKYALTTLTAANYNAITKVDAAPITALADPNLDAVAIQAGKVYLYKTADGEKGLIYVRLISAKTGKIEGVDGQWSDTPYSEVTLAA